MHIRNIRAAISEALVDAGYTAYSRNVESPVVPCAIVGMPSNIVYGQTLKNGATMTLPITFVVDAADLDDAVTRIDYALSSRMTEEDWPEGWTGPTATIPDTLYACGLNGLRLTAANNFRLWQAGDSQYPAFDVYVEIFAS